MLTNPHPRPLSPKRGEGGRGRMRVGRVTDGSPGRAEGYQRNRNGLSKNRFNNEFLIAKVGAGLLRSGCCGDFCLRKMGAGVVACSTDPAAGLAKVWGSPPKSRQAMLCCLLFRETKGFWFVFQRDRTIVVRLPWPLSPKVGEGSQIENEAPGSACAARVSCSPRPS